MTIYIGAGTEMLRFLAFTSVLFTTLYAQLIGRNNTRLLYFENDDRVEPIRLILGFTTNHVNEEKIKISDWPKVKTKVPWAVLPVYYIDSFAIPEVWSIYRFLGKRLLFNGMNDKEATRVDSLAELFRDWYDVAMNFLALEKSDKAKAAPYMSTYVAKSNEVLPIMDSEVRGGYLFVGTWPTWIDFVVAHAIKIHNEKHPEVIGKYRVLLEHSKRFYQIPQIQRYLSG